MRSTDAPAFRVQLSLLQSQIRTLEQTAKNIAVYECENSGTATETLKMVGSLLEDCRRRYLQLLLQPPLEVDHAAM